ncbi:DUF4157 domain-containing protein [Streptomyces sp. NPDC050485]|uniref:eCIS core domain-containing protein n=1 Tax=Streptomyces sp. NPDC050485 TaxID=3365617 RepID=UPI00378D49FE
MYANEQARTSEGNKPARSAARTAAPGSGAPAALLALQSTAGNAAVVQMLRGAGHVWAQEQHQHGAGCGHQQTEQPAVQRSSVHDVLRAPGRPLDDAIRTDMEARLGADFSDVRIHNDSAAKASAAEVGARAYTSGSHVVIGDGGADKHTLAHELTHVIQQRRGPVAGTPTADGLRVSDPSDAFEREAEARATRALSGPSPERTAPGEPARQDTAHGQVQRVPAPMDLSVQRLTIDDAPSSWHGQAVRRSGEGVDGVFFVGPPGAAVVVKPLSSTGNVEYAHRFLEHMDIRAPRIERHAVTSPEGRALHDLLMNNQAAGRTPEEIPNQLRTAQAFLVMETAPGATLQGMDADAALRFLGDEAALRQTGRTMVADAFLGNDDRVVGGRVNLGNFLYQAATAIAPTAQLTAIDNNSRFTAPEVLPTRAGGKKLDDRLAAKLGYLKMLRDPAHDNAFINRFLQRFRQAHHNSPEVTGILDDTAQSGPIKDRIGEGVTVAFADLATVFTDHQFLLRAIGSGYDEASAADRSVSGAKAAAKYVADTQNGLTHDQAVDQLIGYVEKRCAKDKLPTGLKWIGQLVA